MALLNLIARLGLDSSGFDAGLNKAEASTNIFAKKFQKSLTQGVTKFATIGFAVNTVRDVITNADKLKGVSDKTVTSLQDIGDGFMAVWDGFKSVIGVLTSINPFFLPFRAIGSALRGGTTPPDMERTAELEKMLAERKIKHAEELKKVLADIAEETDKNSLKELSDEERKTELLRRRKAILDALVANKRLPELTAWSMILQAEKLRGQAMGIDTEKKAMEADTFRRTSILDRPRDPLARIGGFTGGGDVKIVTLQERIAKATEDTAKNTAGNTITFG